MTLWEYLDRRADRQHRLREKSLHHERVWQRLIPHDFRGWLGCALFLQSTFLFCLLAIYPHLNENQGFLTLASAVIVTGWVGGAAAFAYSAGKSSAETREQMGQVLDLAKQHATQQKATLPSAASDLDASGVPWDERIHSSTKEKDGEGNWIKRGDIDDATFTTIEEELRNAQKGG